jgi:hypothetical protein
MLKAVAHSDTGETLVILGLSDINVEKLKEGLPILVEMEELGFKGKLAIIYGETEDALAKQFKDNMEIDQEIDLRKPETLT